LLDGGGSNSKTAGQGFAGGLSYEHFFDRSGLSDSFTLRADYLSSRFATLNNLDGINSTSISLSGQYTRQFSMKFLTTSTATYLKGRNGRGDSYRLGTTGYYRLNREWTFRAGVDYAKYSSSIARGDGFSVSIGLVFQPDYRRRAEARYESRDDLKEVSYNQSGLNQLNSVGFGAVVAEENNNARAQGYATYTANRFDAAISHASFGPSISDFGAVNATSVRVGTTLAFADGMFGIGRRINDSFMLLSAHENLGDRSVVAGQSLAENNYISRSGPLGSAVNNFLGSYSTQSVQYDVEDPPTGYDVGTGVFRVYPSYKSGYAARIGTDAFVTAMGTLMLTDDKPVSLIGGRTTLLDIEEGDSPKPSSFFTNSVGRFAIANLLPGRRYLVETYGPNGTIDKSFEFTVPADTDGLVNLGIVKPGMKK
jgi:outer membrane usher protein